VILALFWWWASTDPFHMRDDGPPPRGSWTTHPDVRKHIVQ
jgi:hypothetical protein